MTLPGAMQLWLKLDMPARISASMPGGASMWHAKQGLNQYRVRISTGFTKLDCPLSARKTAAGPYSAGMPARPNGAMLEPKLSICSQ